ncbi:LOW QUALITY PROTEIN: glutathione S-transferase 1-like [Macrobrachium nipponense]|uniref:LOW QUALITY PROTEIN: glutathione S-transferase 1-like n=1 Tax=Macrobrachium nipponense TaxID=159736 RepID=UPI0030C89BAB
MPVDLYYHKISPPCRSVHLTAKAVGLSLNLKELDILKGEQMTPEFLPINPQHTIPALVDGHIKLWESRAICSYIASQYGKDDSLYPTNPKARCIVDQRLYFDMGTLQQRWHNYYAPSLIHGKLPDPADMEKVEEALNWLNDILKEYPWTAGNTMTVADFCLAATVSTINACGAVDLQKYTRIDKWLQKCSKQMVGYNDINVPGAEECGELYKSRLEAVKAKEKLDD